MKRVWNWVSPFLIYFVLVTTILSVNMILFLSFLDFTEAEIRAAAPITMFNVLFLTMLLYLVDLSRRYYMIQRPVKIIQESIQRVIDGDLSFQISSRNVGGTYAYNKIIDGINHMIEELRTVETLRSDFISTVSHELKTPLAVLQNDVALLQSPDLSEAERMEYAQKAEEQTQLLSALISNILRLNKLENQTIYPNMERYDVAEQICECMLRYESLWEQKKLDISAELEPDTARIIGDRELMELVWSNLISNAIKFTEPGGTIRLEANTAGDTVTVRITDTGCGMDAETVKQIFQKFYQGDTSHSTEGNGLGLALVKKVLEIHGGQIKVESAPGSGSTFTVTLKSA